MLCMLAAGSLLIQSVDAQTRGGNTRGGQTTNPGGGAPGQPGGGQPGGRGGFGAGGPGGFMGGMRGMMGGGGMMGRIAASPVFLLRSEAVQKELKLTTEQKDKLKKAEENQNDQLQKMFEDMRNQNQRGQQGQRGQQNQGGRGGFDFTAIRTAMEKMNSEAESAYAKILTADQRKRLAEIALQVEGPMAIINRTDIAKKLNLQQQQLSRMNQVKQAADKKQQEMRTQMMTAMGFGRGGQPGGRGGAPGQAGGGQPGGRGGFANNNMTAEERQKRADEMRQSMEKMREQSEKLNKDLEAAILKLLTKRQSDAFKKMNGEKFDVDSIAETMNFGRGGPGGRGGRGPTSVD